jgi:hypothetical protein
MSRAALVLSLALPVAGCGYHLAGGGLDPAGPFAIVSAPGATPYVAVAAAAEAGARAELARASELASCSPSGGACPALVVEVTRVEETSAGIAAGLSGAAPLAAGVRIAVTGRAWIRGGRAGERASGDVTVVEIVARTDGAVAGALAHDVAAERAGRRLGERLARRALGYAEPEAE